MIWWKKAIAVSLITAGGVALPQVFNPAQAETSSYERQIITKPASRNDDVGVAFMKTAGNFPDFTKLVENSPEYRALDAPEQPAYLAQAVEKLQAKYLAFTPRQSDLIIRLKVNALFRRLENGMGTLKITIPGATGQTYFPYFFADTPIALLVDGFDAFQDITLSKEEADIVYATLALSGAATLILQLYPVAADDTKPLQLDNVAQYPLLSEIGYIGLVNKRAEQIWAWKNAKYSGPKKNIGGAQSGALIDMIPKTTP